MSSDDEVGSEDDDDEKESDREEGEAPAARADAKPAIDNALLKCLELYPSAYPLPFVGGGDDAWEDAYSDMPRTLIELKMCELSNAIREKSEWWIKSKDAAIAGKWAKETLQAQEASPESERLTQKMIDYVLAELDDHARVREKTTGIETGCFERIWRSDSLVPSAVQKALLAAVAKAEDVPADQLDWHPNSDKQVLDLVHPSLWPVVYDRTLDSTTRSPIAASTTPEGVDDSLVSKHFAWLPAEFTLDDSQAKLLSPYINNIHPDRDVELVNVIERLVICAVPLWKRVLADLSRPLSPYRTACAPEWALMHDGHVLVPRCIWADGERPWPTSDDEAEDGFVHEEWEERQPKVYPEALDKYEGGLSCIPSEPAVDLESKPLRVIVKLANIILTPEKPDYNGGSWHIEGTFNESIVSTFLYYYDEVNITESRLAFRASVSEPVYHGQDDSVCMKLLYGIDRDEPCLQSRGSILTKQDRCIAFPNVYQHCVQPFKLADASKLGHRKIVALFLVDPDWEGPTSTTVAPQQKEWLLDLLLSLDPEESRIRKKLPNEIIRRIVEQVEGTMWRHEAEEVRLRLMAERTSNRRSVDDGSEDDEPQSKGSGWLFERPFNLCEH